MKLFLSRIQINPLVLLLLLAYALFYLFRLTSLPVFADEAIYIRWAQQMAHEPTRLWFYPMLDGKPPLFMWLLIGFLQVFLFDPLWAARAMVVAFGMIGLVSFLSIIRSLGGKPQDLVVGALFYGLMPFMFFHYRMGLLDPLVTTFSMLSMQVLLSSLSSPRRGIWAGFTLGLALLTKTSALFLLPALILVRVFLIKRSQLRQEIGSLLILVGISIGVFLILKVSPLFPSLFSRSGDFTFTLTELIDGEWQHSISNIERISSWLIHYSSIPFMILVLVGLGTFWTSKYHRLPLGLLLGGLVYLLPFVVLGRVLSSRYLLPSMVFFLPLGMIGWLLLKKRFHYFRFGLLVWFVVASLRFDLTLMLRPNETPFTPEDRGQYLTEWSSGHGIVEVRDFLMDTLPNERVLVVTEGYFGTLPDGLMMYFDASPLIQNLELYGIGQPIRSIPKEVIERSNKELVYLVVNEHRLELENDSCCDIIKRFPRPYDGPDLLVLQVRDDS